MTGYYEQPAGFYLVGAGKDEDEGQLDGPYPSVDDEGLQRTLRDLRAQGMTVKTEWRDRTFSPPPAEAVDELVTKITRRCPYCGAEADVFGNCLGTCETDDDYRSSGG